VPLSLIRLRGGEREGVNARGGTPSWAGELLEVLEAIRTRRSIRRYGPEEVPWEQVETLIDAARWAPSAGNLQPWEFVVVREQRTKELLARAALNQRFIAQAPVVVVVCADPLRSASVYGPRGSGLYCVQDTAAATQNMLLAAHSLGLGTCWVGAFYENEVRQVLGIPPDIRPVAIVPIGRPAESLRPPRRRSLEEIIHLERF